MHILWEASTSGLNHSVAFHSKKLCTLNYDPKTSPWQFRLHAKALSGLFKEVGFKLSAFHFDAEMIGRVRDQEWPFSMGLR